MKPSSWSLAVLLVAAVPARAQEHVHGERLGTVSFGTSCGPAAQREFDRAVALLHSFEFGPAIEGFGATKRAEPACALAEWGIALASWGNPFAAGVKTTAQIARGSEAVARAVAAAPRTAREKAYVDAVAELYRDAGARDQQTRVAAYRDAMARLAAAYPDDMEAQVFYALALAQAVPATDKTYGDLLKAGAILEGLVAEHPDHPGLAHYIIHSYDVPPLAGRALDAARRYARIAPSAPHALHMPSHTFTRLGLWQDSIESNLASAAAARRDGATAEELHASDYLAYAYLQTAQDAAARRILDALPEIASRFDANAVGSAAPGVAGVFALAAIPARFALERGAWAEAARLDAHPGAFAQAEAITDFARALGAARSGDAAAARAAVSALVPLRERLAAAHEGYWAGQVEIQWTAASAWLALAEGHRDAALAAMRQAAALEDATEKNAMTPGPLAPARELLGEMLLEVGQPAPALEAFATTLRREPNRFRALAGARQAAQAAGDMAAAREYAARLVKVCERADGPVRPALEEARRAAGF